MSKYKLPSRTVVIYFFYDRLSIGHDSIILNHPNRSTFRYIGWWIETVPLPLTNPRIFPRDELREDGKPWKDTIPFSAHGSPTAFWQRYCITNHMGRLSYACIQVCFCQCHVLIQAEASIITIQPCLNDKRNWIYLVTKWSIWNMQVILLHTYNNYILKCMHHKPNIISPWNFIHILYIHDGVNAQVHATSRWRIYCGIWFDYGRLCDLKYTCIKAYVYVTYKQYPMLYIGVIWITGRLSLRQASTVSNRVWRVSHLGDFKVRYIQN